VTQTLLLDNSAWARLADPALSDDRVSEIADAFEAGRIGTCLPFLLEAGYFARTARDHDELFASGACGSHLRAASKRTELVRSRLPDERGQRGAIYAALAFDLRPSPARRTKSTVRIAQDICISFQEQSV
jgi:hypothetical protein